LMPTMNFMTRFYRNPILSGRLISENILKVLPLLLTAGVLFIATACEENPSKIGAGLLPGSDFVTIKSTDSITVKSYTMYQEAVQSQNPAYSYLGAMWDPYFGTTTGEFVSQLWLQDSLTKADFVAIDSVRLYLKILTVKGDTAAGHILKISEISKMLYYNTDTVYYSNQTPPLTGDSWTAELPALRADTINDFYITLDTTFGAHLTRNRSMGFMSTTKPDFRSFFKGLKFEIVPSAKPVFLSLSVQSVGSSGTPVNFFTVFTHNSNGDFNYYDFLLDAQHTSAKYNLFSHTFSDAEPGKQIQHINDGYADTLSYLQNMNGLYTRIEIPYLKAMKSDPNFKNVAINKARLIIPFVVNSTADIIYTKTIPSTIYLRYKDFKGNKYMVTDYSTAGAIFYDGSPDTLTTMSYKINLATYLQQYLKDPIDSISTDLELFLPATSEYNAILAANKNHRRVKFEFTYTKF
jgi:hypothetical protein